MYFSRSVKFPYYSIFCIQRKTLFMKLSRPTLNFIKQDSIFIGSIGYDACSVNKSLKNFILTLDIFLFLKNIYLFDMQDLHCDMQDLSVTACGISFFDQRLNQAPCIGSAVFATGPPGESSSPRQLFNWRVLEWHLLGAELFFMESSFWPQSQ